jgi:hypothetical protein
MKEKGELLIYIFGAALSLSIFLAIIKIFGVPITWVAAMLPLLTYVAIMSILLLIGSIAEIVTSIQDIMKG